MAKLTLYHGTAHDFEAFDRHFTLRGTEPNSALGIHLTESPAIAADYAELAARDRHAGEPRVLVVEAEIERAALIGSVEDFLGRPMDLPLGCEGARSREDFVAARMELEAKGFDAVALDTAIDDLVGTWVVFEPSRVRIAGSLSVDEAWVLEEENAGPGWKDVDLVSTVLFGDDPASSPSR